MYEFSNGGIKAESLHGSATEGKDKFYSGGVDAVSSTDTIRTRSEKVIYRPILLLIDGEDGTY
jgi:hypothetical protein